MTLILEFFKKTLCCVEQENLVRTKLAYVTPLDQKLCQICYIKKCKLHKVPNIITLLLPRKVHEIQQTRLHFARFDYAKGHK